MLPRFTATPIEDHRIEFAHDGKLITRWHFGKHYPGPFFYPISTPRGGNLTRMGHPGAPDHDHHRSVWFAHNDLYGHDFWSAQSTCRIEQKEWYALEDGQTEARFCARLDWLDGHNPHPLVQQELTVEISSGTQPYSYRIEIQSEFHADAEGIEFRKNNFGILGIRMAKSISTHFGDGVILGKNGKQGEPATFGEPNRWIDYSGTVFNAEHEPMKAGITLFDHPDNPSHPTRWHTRVDGWFGPSLSRLEPVPIPQSKPLMVRYMLMAHATTVTPTTWDGEWERFAKLPPLKRIKGSGHTRWKLERSS